MTNYFDSCQAMLDAGITDPESYEGKHFCTQKCPYPDDCILFDIEEKVRSKKKSRKASIVRLKNKGKSFKEIAGELDISVSTVQNCLK